MSPHPSDAVLLDLQLACIVGILPRERIEPQPLHVSLRMALDLGPTGDSGDLGYSVDYGAIDAQVRFLAVEGRFRLIESLGLAILRTVLLPPASFEARAAVRHAVVRITKPAVLLSASAAVELARDAAWGERTPVAYPGGGSADEVVRVPEVEVRRLVVPEGTWIRDDAGFGIAGDLGRLAVPCVTTAPSVVIAVRREPAD